MYREIGGGVLGRLEGDQGQAEQVRRVWTARPEQPAAIAEGRELIVRAAVVDKAEQRDDARQADLRSRSCSGAAP